MHPPVDTKDPTAVEVEVQGAYLTLFPEGDRLFVPLAFGWVIECFTGNYRDYQAVDARYHDLEHTLQGTLCMARLLLGRHRGGAPPAMTPRMFELGLLAILLHDTGYLKKRADTEGTGAKYTMTHVHRSAEFAARLLTDKGFTSSEITAVENMIYCTGVDVDLSRIGFQSELERITGFALATADLLGQMAAADYLEKLPILYAEFAEAVRFSKTQKHFIAKFNSPEELMQNTPIFWKDFVKVRLDRELGGLFRFLSDPYPSGPNAYIERVEANIERLKRLMAASSPGSVLA